MSPFESIFCPVCLQNNFETRIQNIKPRSFFLTDALNINLEVNLDLVRCKICGHHFIKNQLKQELLERYYSKINSEYYEKRDLILTTKYEKKNFFLKKLISKYRNDGKILEIGAGLGFLMNLFDNTKWDKHAIEPSVKASSMMKENTDLNVICDFFTDGLFPKNYFDIILLFDVIEHIKNPNEVIAAAVKILKPGGFIFVGTGNIGSLNAIISGKNWRYFCTLEHISFFNKKSIRYLLDKNKLKVVKILNTPHDIRYSRNVISFLKNVIKILLGKISEKYTEKYYHSFHLAFDHMIVIGQKHENEKLTI